MFIFNVFAIATLALNILVQGAPVSEGSFELEARGLLHTRAPAADKCASVQGCSNCVASKNVCGFNKSTFRCEKKGTGQVTTNQGCPLMNQMQGV
ncbi:hypothetical protein NEOLEDRAFT_1139636 [Neolentinus lepideus HHB14362 ss-1]|uniref:PSI domain-containing protein n=1 Tax=Neolentinus lepideus HHB14362 ss-1 TaxID=1314782 RepID=A0A165PNV5_9AGAM|nr:hypothetical protein NEOLEDRAFT_1139636 [Neolentinus lepideus HHB14362 ss-1]